MKPRFLIFEFSPVAEEIWKIKCSPKQGYLDWNSEKGIVSFLDIAQHETKVRPEVSCVYAAGKAANVARVLSGINHYFQKPCEVALKTLLPKRQPATGNPPPAVAEFIRLLQQESMQGVDLLYEEIEFENTDGKARRAIHIIDADTRQDLVNFTPRLHWSAGDMENAIGRIASPDDSDWTVIAGTPPVGCETFYQRIIPTMRKKSDRINISLDASGAALHGCLENTDSQPEIVTVNQEEYLSVGQEIWKRYCNKVFVHNRNGCWAFSGGGGRLFDAWDEVPYIDIGDLQKSYNGLIGPTLGAGDAFHAGVLYAYGVLKLDEVSAAAYGLAAATAAVRSGVGVSGLDYRELPTLFERISRLKPDRRKPD
ncbi:MAG: hypothetical protein ACU833_07505 [Gammaproteobacteria bacterium]